MSHHLTSYFYLISLIGIIFVENIKDKNWTPTLRKDVIYILTNSLLMFAYWAFIAITVYESFMGGGLSFGKYRLDPIFIVIMFYILFFAMFAVIKFIRKHKKSIKERISLVRSKLVKEKEKYRFNRFAKKFFLALILEFLAVGFFTFIAELPWTGFKLTPHAVFYISPLLVVVALAVAGFSYTYRTKNGKFICGWIFAILLSFTYAIVTENGIILAHRHLEYMMAPLAIFAVYGLGGIFSDPENKILLSKLLDKKDLYLTTKAKKIKISYRRRILHLFVILVVVMSLAAWGYPSHRSLNISVEDISAEDIAVIEWMSENLDKNITIIASDHRLGRMAEAYGFNTTKDKTRNMWESENLDEYIEELMGIGKNHTRITHVIVDDIMKNDVVHVHFKISVYMTNETWTGGYDKFQFQPFERIYRNETIDIDPVTLEPVHWAEIYSVNWTYIDRYYLPSLY
jgi:hypothetical protein